MRKNRLVFALILALDIILFLVTNSAPPLILALVMAVLGAAELVYMAVFSRTLRIGCEWQPAAETDKDIEIKLSLTTPLPVILGTITVLFSSDNKMFGIKSEILCQTEIFIKAPNVKIPIDNALCGTVDFKIGEVCCYGTFRLFGMRRNHNLGGQIKIYPSRANINAMFEHTAFAEHEGNVYDLFRKGSDRSETLEIRDWANGDNRKDIHWKLSSKLDKIVVRQFARPNNFSTMILCDMSRSVGGVEIPCRSIRAYLTVALAVSESLAESGAAHSVCILGNGIELMKDIEDVGDCSRLLDEVMALRVRDGEFNTLAAFGRLIAAPNFSRLVIISGHSDETALRILENEFHVVMITTNNDGKNAVASDGSLTKISLDEATLCTSSHNISI